MSEAQEVYDLAMEKFHSLLTNGEEVKPYVLGQIITTAARVIERTHAPAPTVVQEDLLGSIASLPPDRQRELLEDEIERLRAQLADYEERLEDLDGKEHA
jgi:hypothetical protein